MIESFIYALVYLLLDAAKVALIILVIVYVVLPMVSTLLDSLAWVINSRNLITEKKKQRAILEEQFKESMEWVNNSKRR